MMEMVSLRGRRAERDATQRYLAITMGGERVPRWKERDSERAVGIVSKCACARIRVRERERKRVGNQQLVVQFSDEKWERMKSQFFAQAKSSEKFSELTMYGGVVANFQTSSCCPIGELISVSSRTISLMGVIKFIYLHSVAYFIVVHIDGQMGLVDLDRYQSS